MKTDTMMARVNLPDRYTPTQAVYALARAVVQLQSPVDGSVTITYSARVFWDAMYAMIQACRRTGCTYPVDVHEWRRLLETRLSAWPLPLPATLRCDAALLTAAGRPTQLAHDLAAAVSRDTSEADPWRTMN